MAHSSLEVIFFDAVGTLIRLTESVGTHYARVAGRFGVAVGPEALEEAFVRAWKETPGRPPSGQARPDDDRAWWRDLVGRVFAHAEAVPHDFEACFGALYDQFAEPGVWALYPDAAAALGRLGRDHRLAVISNFDTRLHRVLEHLKIADHFECLTISSEVGADKPHPEIFESALETMGVVAGRTLHVGDHPELDWKAAERVGMQVFRLDRPRNSLRDLLPTRSSQQTEG